MEKIKLPKHNHNLKQFTDETNQLGSVGSQHEWKDGEGGEEL